MVSRDTVRGPAPSDVPAKTAESEPTASAAPPETLRSAFLAPDPDDPRWTQVVKLAELGVMTASVLHELRQPLFALKGYLQLLHHDGQTQGHPSPKLTRSLALVEEIEAMAGGLLDFSRAAGNTLLPIDLRDVLDAACILLRNRIRRANATLELHVEEHLPGIRGNPGTLSQVLVNLLVNAVDALSSLEPDRPRKIWVVAHALPERAQVQVLIVDSGCGIDQAHRDRLFDWFFTTKEPGKGTGLGLAIAREITAAHGGSLILVPDPAQALNTALAAPGPWRQQTEAPRSSHASRGQASATPATAFAVTLSILSAR